jgi:hypothetical protein
LQTIYEYLILNDDLYYDFYIDSFSFDRIEGMLKKKHEQKWLLQAIFLLIYAFKLLLTTLAFSTAFFAWNKPIDFILLFKACILAEGVFLFKIAIKVIWFSLIGCFKCFNALAGRQIKTTAPDGFWEK